MIHRHFRPLFLILAFSSLGAAHAQIPGIPGSVSGAGGVGMPDVLSMSAGNATGVLEYCVKNKLVGGDASSVLGKLSAKPDVKVSEGYLTGQAGTVVSSDGSKFSLDSAPKEMKSKVCDMVLQQSKSLIL
jgi:hypothetical protein